MKWNDTHTPSRSIAITQTPTHLLAFFFRVWRTDGRGYRLQQEPLFRRKAFSLPQQLPSIASLFNRAATRNFRLGLCLDASPG